MDKLIQTSICSIIYGTFRGEKNQELFRCPRELDHADLKKYLNEGNALVGFEDDDTEDLRNVDGKTFIGYYRMYYRNGWYGSWITDVPSDFLSANTAIVKKIVDHICEKFTYGCDFYMKDYMKEHYKEWAEQRYCLKPIMNDYCKVLVDTTYGNGDYPVRIFVYKDAK